MVTPPTVRLKRNRDKPVRNRHPWIFSGAIDAVDGNAGSGEIVDVRSNAGAWLARGTFNPNAELAVRILSWNPDEAITDEWLRGRIQSAIERRRDAGLLGEDTACRLIYAEADGLPGLVVDRYADTLVVSMALPFLDARREVIVEALTRVLAPGTIYERSDEETREREGLPPSAGALAGFEPPELVAFREGPVRLLADVRAGHKTGFYLDQRVNRTRVASFAAGRRVLDTFSYTGAFGLAALKAGATSVLDLDASEAALELGARLAEENGVATLRSSVQGDAFKVLREFRDEGRSFDLIVLDPPKFAYARAHVQRACRGYKDLNLLALKILSPGGILATFSCSGLVSAHLFGQVVAAAAMDSGREVRLLEKLTQSPDHPALLTFPESEYLKGMILRVD